MDFNLKQWRNQQYESENEPQHSSKIPKLHGNNNTPQYQKPELLPSESALPLFLPQQQLQQSTKITTQMSPNPFPDHHSTHSPTFSRLPKMGSGYFSVTQWQELELQALIFRHMIAGAAVPAELLQPIQKSIALLNASHCFLHPHHYCQPGTAALFQTGYWGRAAMDPEPGRCRRTDGKKWRCSRDVVVGQKYCERHVHRGRNRSRKPVEAVPTHVAGKVAGAGGVVLSGDPVRSGSGGGGSVDLTSLSRSVLDAKRENKRIFEPHDGAKSDGHVLSLFFDDWPRSLQEPDNVVNSSTNLSISTPGNASSDVSLKLSTGVVLGGPGQEENRAHLGRVSSGPTEWASGPMGGPLAEALRSAHSTSSPTSVLHQLPRG